MWLNHVSSDLAHAGLPHRHLQFAYPLSWRSGGLLSFKPLVHARWASEVNTDHLTCFCVFAQGAYLKFPRSFHPSCVLLLGMRQEYDASSAARKGSLRWQGRYGPAHRGDYNCEHSMRHIPQLTSALVIKLTRQHQEDIEEAGYLHSAHISSSWSFPSGLRLRRSLSHRLLVPSPAHPSSLRIQCFSCPLTTAS